MARPVQVEASIRDRMTQRMQRMERQVNRFERSWARTGRVAQRASRMLGAGLNLVDRGLHRVWRRARLAMLMLQVTASIMGGMAVKAAMDYERSLRQVFTLMDDAGSTTAAFEQRFKDMDRTIRGISTRTKMVPQQLAEGLYDVVSTGFEAADAAVILEVAAKGAYAGLTEVDVAAALLTQTLQAFRQEGESSTDMAAKAAGMMDMFFNAVNVGVFTFEELGMKFGDVASTAAAFGVKLEDLLAFLSTATVRGVGLDEAITSARQTLLSIASSTPATQDALEELFGSSEKAKESFSAQALAEKGLIGVMGDLSEVLGGRINDQIVDIATAMEEDGGDAAGFLAEKIGITVDALTDLFPNIRALKGVLAVSGPGLATYGEHWEKIGSDMGAVDRAAQEIDKSASGALQGLKAVWAQFKIDVGNIALPWIKTISDNLVEWWGGLPERFAQEQVGMVMPGMSIEDEQRRSEEVARIWSEADPGEKISFVLRTAWSDALSNLIEWFDSGGGKQKITDIGEKIGTALGQALSMLFGLEAEEVKDSIFYKIGAAAAQGFMDGFRENFDIGAALGNVATGEGVVGGALQLYLVSKLAKGLLGRGGGGAGGAGGAGGGVAAGAGGGLLARLIGGASMGTLVGLGALNFGAITSDLSQGLGKGSMIGAIAGMFGIGPQSPWGRPSAEGRGAQRATPEQAAAIHGGYISPQPVGPAATSMSRHGDRISQRQERAAQDLESGGRTVDVAATDMRLAGTRQMEAATRMLTAADRLGSVKLGFPGMTGPGSNSPGTRNNRAQVNALGSIGTVRKPTLFMAGESGSEDYEFTPHRGGKRGGGPRGRSLSVAGPLIGHVTVANDYDVKKMMSAVNREIEKAFANG